MAPALPRAYHARKGVSFISVIPTTFFALCALLFSVALQQGAGGVCSWIGFGFAGFLAFFAARALVRAHRITPRIFPYFDKRGVEANTVLFGHALARNCLRLDALAEERGRPALSALGVEDPAWGEPRVWHDATDGLLTTRALLDAVAARHDAVDDAEAVLEELERVHAALESARGANARFALHLCLVDSYSPTEWEARKGFV